MNALMDIWTVFWRDWVVLRRRLTKFILSRMVAPMLYLVAFGWGLGRSIQVASGTYLDFLVPGILGALAQAGMQLRLVRTQVLDTLRQDYVRTAYSKGIKQKTVLFRHAFRNAMIPVITIIGGSVGALVGGNMILENIFNIPGIGTQMVTALGQRDYPVVQGCVLVMTVFVMIVNLIVDLAYKWIDPRVKLD